MRAKKSVVRKLRETTLPELAVLEMTNDPKGKSKSGSVMVTTKEAYVWAVLMAHISEKHPEITAQQLIHVATNNPNIRGSIKFFYSAFPADFGERNATSLVPDSIASSIRSLHLDINPAELFKNAARTYGTLVRRRWIEDPVEILIAKGLALAVMGLVPVSFTQKTKEGRRVSKKLKALYWTYEKSESRGITTTKVEFRLLRMIKAFRAGMINGFKNAMRDDTDEEK